MTLTLLKQASQLFWRMCFSLGLFDGFSWLHWVYALLGRIPQRWGAFLSSSKQGTWCQFVLLVIMNLDQLAQMLSARSLYYKFTVFYLCSYLIFCESYFETVLKLLLNFSIHWFCSASGSYDCGVLMVLFICSIPFIFINWNSFISKLSLFYYKFLHQF